MHGIPTCFRARSGFSLIELLVVLFVMAAALGVATPSVRRSLVQMRLDRAANVVAADMRLAPSLAARQRRPVNLQVDTVGRRYTLVDRNSGTVLHSRLLGAGEFAIASLATTATEVTFYPNGLASGAVTMSVRAGGRSRSISVTRAGQVRVSQ
jgi:type II secretion system protein H